jgi:hypothetical protein
MDILEKGQQTYFQIPKALLEDSGLRYDRNIMIYTRQAVLDEWKFLRDDVIRDSKVGWILGPPGTGKSISAYSFLLDLYRRKHQECIITWIHLFRDAPPRYEQFHGGYKYADTFTVKDLDEILYIESEKNHLVVLDGYADIEKHKDIRWSCAYWYSHNKSNGRLVTICSMASRRRTKIDDDIVLNVKEFHMDSWCIEEYEQAINNKTFFESIQDCLDSSLNSKERTPSELIHSKHYFAGGSSRFMFTFKTSEVLELLDQSIRIIGDVLPYIQGTIGDQSDNVVNRLFNVFKKKRSIVSEYAATQLALAMGPLLIENISASLQKDLNPAMKDWLLEMWFFASLCKEGVKIYDRQENEEEEPWPKSNVLNFDPNDMSTDTFLQSPIWLKPLKWNQGGYDAVYVDKEKNLVRFVQVTRGKDHSFKIGYFAHFLEKFRQIETEIKGQSIMEVKNLDIYFLVPKKKIQEFNIKNSQITGEGLLHIFAKGWEKGNEHNQVKVRGIQGCDQ